MSEQNQTQTKTKKRDWDRHAEGVIGEISSGYYTTWWIVRHPFKTMLRSLGVVGAIATLICLWNFVLGFAPGQSFGVLKPINADVGEWGSRASETAQNGRDKARQAMENLETSPEDE